MIRILFRLLGIRDFEECKGCEILKQQLEIANLEKERLMNTMLGLVKPEVVQSPLQVVKPFVKTGASWVIQKKMLEEKDREEFRIKMSLRDQTKVTPEIEKLEKELGVDDRTENASS